MVPPPTTAAGEGVDLPVMSDSPSADEPVTDDSAVLTEGAGLEPDADAGAGAGPPPRRLPRFTLDDRVRRVVVTLVVVGALVGIFFTGRWAVTGADSTSQSLPDQVDLLLPASGSEVLVQAQVGVDLADGYTAYLTINGTDVRTAEDGLITNLGTGQILYQPGPGKPVESLNSGQNCVIAMVWDQLETVETAEPVSWCFQAT